MSSSPNASMRNTMVGLRALNTSPQVAPSKVAKKGPAGPAGKVDLVVRGDDDHRRPVFEQVAEEDDERATLAPPPGHAEGSRRVPGEAFRRDAKGRPVPPCYGDVDQGNLADAWLLASCAAVAHSLPAALVRRVRRRSPHDFAIDLGDDTVIVTSELSLEGYADPTPSGQADTLWVALVEKAFAIREGGSYAHLETGNAARALEALTGQRARRVSVTEHIDAARLMKRLVEAKAKSLPMVLKTRSGSLSEPLVGDHNYAVLDVSAEALRIYNPWGTAGGTRPLEQMVHSIPVAQVLREVEALYLCGA
jgi:hypothetical protein